MAAPRRADAPQEGSEQRLGAAAAPRAEGRGGGAAADAGRVAPAEGAAAAAPLPAALQERAGVVALHPRAVHDGIADVRDRARGGGVLLRESALVGPSPRGAGRGWRAAPGEGRMLPGWRPSSAASRHLLPARRGGGASE